MEQCFRESCRGTSLKSVGGVSNGKASHLLSGRGERIDEIQRRRGKGFHRRKRKVEHFILRR